MHTVLSRHLLPLLFLLLSACTALQPKPEQTSVPAAIHQQHLASLERIKSFQIQGRIGVQTNPRGFSGSMRWQHEASRDQIQLFSPLGSQVAQIQTTDSGVELITDDGKHYEAADAAALTQQTLGWSLPMRGLPDWVLGRPSAGIIAKQAWDAQGRLILLQQDGWNIEYTEYIETEGVQLPSRISLKSPKVNLKLIIERWTLAPQNIQATKPRASS